MERPYRLAGLVSLKGAPVNAQLAEAFKSAGMIGVITRPAIVATILFGVWRALGRCSSSKLLGGRESLGFVSWRLGVRAFDHTQTMRQCDHPGSSGSAEKEQGSAEPARVGRSAGEESLCLCCHGITMVQTANSRSRLNPASLAQSHSDGAALWRVLGEP